MKTFTLIVPDDFLLTERVDSYIAKNIPDMNRSKLKSGLNELLVNEKFEKLSYKIKASDKIFFSWDDSVPDDIVAENIPLRIIYEDENITVINKKQGMVVHPAFGNWSGTLVSALLFHWRKSNIHLNKHKFLNDLSYRQGIVHRLDKDTSGVIITAKNQETQDFLSLQFKNHLTKKYYIAIVKGKLPSSSGKISTNIMRDPKNRKRFIATQDKTSGKSACTLYSKIAQYGNYSLVRLKIKTGRTHQIRVHLKYLGCFILGDALYGKKDALFPDATLMLHARKLVINVPGKNSPVTFKAKIPKRFFDCIRVLKNKYEK